ncbi:MAG: 1,4-dihydroxy-2-naphthoate octaprenyltransferase [Syntrophus sp. SKADARSKE-3]|nr:1,4-dihydroxy-2-naphthoate octaprenyltransferase [Syntrophus sp. SKADARSKE-3]
MKQQIADHIKRYFIATRPWSFTMSLISVAVGTLLAAEGGPVSWFWFALIAAGIVFFHAAANLINDYFDTRYGVDREDSPTAKYRPQPLLSGMLTPGQLLAEAIVLLLLTCTIGFTVAFVRSLHVLWIGLIGLGTCIFYTAGPVKFKYKAFGEFAVFMMWGPLMIEGAYAVQRQALSFKALYVSIPFGVLVALVLFANNMRDVAYDSRRNIKTISIMLGSRKSYLLFAGLIFLAYAYVLGMIVTGVMSLWGLLIFLSVPKAVSLLKTFREKIPDMADALTAQFDTVFGVLLILAILMEVKAVP